MGWASGSELADKIWSSIKKIENEGVHIEEEIKAELALNLVNAFEEMDCDTMQECDFVNELLVYDEDKYEWRVKK